MSITLTKYLQHVPDAEKSVADRAFSRGSTEAEAIVRECRDLPQALKQQLVDAIAMTRT